MKTTQLIPPKWSVIQCPVMISITQEHAHAFEYRKDDGLMRPSLHLFIVKSDTWRFYCVPVGKRLNFPIFSQCRFAMFWILVCAIKFLLTPYAYWDRSIFLSSKFSFLRGISRSRELQNLFSRQIKFDYIHSLLLIAFTCKTMPHTSSSVRSDSMDTSKKSAWV